MDALPDPFCLPTLQPTMGGGVVAVLFWQVPPRAAGTYAPEIIVLLTDGANTRGVTPIEAAKVAAARGVRVYPIGFGTTHPTSMVCTPEQLGGSGFDVVPHRHALGNQRSAPSIQGSGDLWETSR